MNQENRENYPCKVNILRTTHNFNKNSGDFKVSDSDKFKIVSHPDLTMKFRKSDGLTVTEGKNEDLFSPAGCYIADIEVTTICHGVPQPDGSKKLCSVCYKKNSSVGTFMSIDTYRKVLDNINQNNVLTQVALGVDAEAKTNPDLEEIFAYTRSKGIVPNLTVAALDDETANLIAKYCGAVAVSRYDNKDICYDTIKKLTDLGMTQVNMHFCIHNDNFDSVMETLDDIRSDSRLEKLNAVVFLSLKQKGRGIGFQRLSDERFSVLYKRCIEEKIRHGFDSCTATRYMNESINYGNYEDVVEYSQSCESTRESLFCNVDGQFFPCSFVEKTKGWETGLDLTNPNINFLDDVWYHPRTVEFRNKLLCTKDCNGNCSCPVFNV